MYRIKRFSGLTSTEKNDLINPAATVAGGIGAHELSKKIDRSAVKSYLKDLKDGVVNKSFNVDLTKDIAKDARSKGVGIGSIKAVGRKNSLGYYADLTDNDQYRATLKELELNKISLKDLKKSSPSTYDAIVNRKPTVFLSNDNPNILAHELGHHEFGRTKVGRVLKGDLYGIGVSPLKYGTLGASFASGMNSAKKKKEGKEEGVVSKNTAWAAPLALTSPALASEFEASRRGIEMLKKAGASGADIRRAKKEMAKAGLSYAAKTGALVGSNYVARGLGKGIGNYYYKEE